MCYVNIMSVRPSVCDLVTALIPLCRVSSNSIGETFNKIVGQFQILAISIHNKALFK
jgi:hypothetical protein